MAGLIANDSSSMLQQKRRIFEGAAPHIYAAHNGQNSDSSSMLHFRTTHRYPIQELWVSCFYTQDGSGDPSPSNIRTIHPQEAVTLTHAGVNLLQCDTFASAQGSGITYTGQRNSDNEIEYIDISGTKTSANTFHNLNYTQNKIKWPPMGSYATYAYTDQARIVYVYDNGALADRNDEKYGTSGAEWKLYDITNTEYAQLTNSAWARIQIMPSAAGTYAIDSTVYPMVCQLQDQGCAYEPYKGKTYSITLPAPAYGASIDLISGNIIERYACETITWGSNYIRSQDLGTHTIRYFPLTYRTVADNTAQSTCNCAPYLYKYSSDTTHQYIAKGSSADYAYIALPNGTSEDTQIQFVYLLQTPQRSTITPYKIFTLPGVNNIWTAEGVPVAIRYWDH